MKTCLVRSFIARSMLSQTCVDVWVCATCAKRATYWWHCKPIVTRLVTTNTSSAVYTIVYVICCWVLSRQFPVRFGWGVSSQSAINTYAWLHLCWMLILVFGSTIETTSSVWASWCHISISCCNSSSWPRACMWSISLLCICTRKHDV